MLRQKCDITDPQGVSSSNVIVSITDHSNTIFGWGSQGITLEVVHWYAQKSRGIFLPPLVSYYKYLVSIHSGRMRQVNDSGVATIRILIDGEVVTNLNNP